MVPSAAGAIRSFAGSMRRVSVFMLYISPMARWRTTDFSDHFPILTSDAHILCCSPSCGPKHEVFQTLILRYQSLVKKKRRCAGDSAPPPRRHIVHDPRHMHSTVQVLFEATQIQPCNTCIAVQIISFQRVLMLEQQGMHRPELALAGRRLCGFGGLLGEWMLVDEWEMPEDEAH